MSENIYPVIPSSTTVPSAPLYEPDFSSSKLSHFEANISSVPCYNPNLESTQIRPSPNVGPASVKITINQLSGSNNSTAISINNKPINNQVRAGTGEPSIVIDCPSNYSITNNTNRRY